jgi:hypothetical protein
MTLTIIINFILSAAAFTAILGLITWSIVTSRGPRRPRMRTLAFWFRGVEPNRQSSRGEGSASHPAPGPAPRPARAPRPSAPRPAENR